MTTVEVLRKARELVARPGGWGQDRDVADECECAITATAAARRVCATTFDIEMEADYFVRAAIGVEREGDVIDWNDAPGRTQAEVVAAFDKAIAMAQQAEGPPGSAPTRSAP